MYVYVHVSRNWVTKRCDSRTQDDVGYVYMNMPEWVVPFPAIVALVGVVHGRTCGCTRRNNSNNMFDHSVHQAHIIPASVQVQVSIWLIISRCMVLSLISNNQRSSNDVHVRPG